MFEYLILQAFQAGLSWITILNKRDNFREAFFDFNAEKIARMDDKDVDRLMQNAGIIRNKQKIEAAIHNAKVLKAMHHRDERLRCSLELSRRKTLEYDELPWKSYRQ